MSPPAYTEDEIAILKQLFSSGCSANEVARGMGRTLGSITKQLIKCFGTSTHKEPYRKWTVEEKQLLVNMRWQGKSWQQISDALGAPIRNCQSMHKDGCHSIGVTAVQRRVESPIVAPAEVIADMVKRASLAPRDLTAVLCGDPKPGYSALERRA